tara:strand:- start:1282 stop:2616 length:1335 start_codon:yes stop_codon:yes gene_type:complete
MKVLSLFDGMSCGRIALDQLGIPVEKYYASEIDKYAMQVSAANYPDIEQVGDICNLDPKDYKDVDLMLAGSPCQGFSFAGKQLAFDDPRSALFFEFIRLLKAIKPKYFLLENVRMKKEFLEVITEQLSQCYEPADVDNQFLNVLGEVRLEPIFINSSLLSAQSRQRYYWTNIPGIKQPEDRGIVLRDILETEPNNFTKMSDKFVKRNGDRNCMIDQNKEKASNLSAMEYVKNGRQGNYLACDDNGKPVHKPVKKTERNRRHLKQLDEKSLCMTATMYKGAGNNGMTLVPQKPKKAYDIPREILKDNERQRRVYDPSGKSPTVLARSDSPKVTTPKQVGVAADINGHDVLKRVYSPDGKSPTVNTCQGGNREPKVAVQSYREVRKEELHWRKLTPLECERLQTVPDNYTNHVSNTQRYKMLGNGWTVEVIKHILQNMEYENDSKS